MKIAMILYKTLFVGTVIIVGVW